MVNLAAIDLNLLVHLDALLQEAHVTRAAQRVGLSQPAMSRALGRLRELLDDELLARSPQGMSLTPLGAQLAPRVRRLLADVATTLGQGSTFHAPSDARTFTIAASDYCALVILPGLISRLREVAPMVRVRTLPCGQGVPRRQLEDGQIDLVLGALEAGEPDVHVETLLQEQLVCAMRADHPALDASWTATHYAALSHAQITPAGEGGGVVDAALAALGLERQVTVEIAHFMVAPLIAATTDLVVTLPARIGQAFAHAQGLALRAPPLTLAPFALSMAWHARADQDAGLTWLRAQVMSVARALASEDA